MSSFQKKPHNPDANPLLQRRVTDRNSKGNDGLPPFWKSVSALSIIKTQWLGRIKHTTVETLEVLHATAVAFSRFHRNFSDGATCISLVWIQKEQEPTDPATTAEKEIQSGQKGCKKEK